MALPEEKKKGILQNIVSGVANIPNKIKRGVGDYWKMLNPSKDDLTKRYPKVAEMARRKKLYGETVNKGKIIPPSVPSPDKSTFGKMRDTSVGVGYPVPPSK